MEGTFIEERKARLAARLNTPQVIISDHPPALER
jgi:hypothetical protein